ncbi:MAG: hypothetical protein AAF501_21300 [Pseudomonadota bacterium]
MRLAVLIALLALPAAAGQRADLYGTWGTAKQCERAPIVPGGTALAEPFVITADWLKQGRLWCRLDWYPVEQRAAGIFTGADAHCGEDAVRGYILGMDLTDDALTLRWNVLLSNGPLMRCTAPSRPAPP